MASKAKNCISFEEAPFSPIHKKIAVGTFMGQICDGYVLGIVGIALTYATDILNLDGFWMGLVGAGALFGILLGSLMTGVIIDRTGRKSAYKLVALVTLVLSVIQFFLSDPLTLVIVRFALGMCVGADYTVGVSLLSEWTPERIRTKMMSWLMAAWTFGYIISYFLGLLIGSMGDLGDNGWRWIISSSAVFALITYVIRIGTPESPRWLLAKDRAADALALVRERIGQNYALPTDEEEVASASFSRLFSKELWRNTVTSCTFFLCQVLPFFAISIFLPVVVEGLHMGNSHASGMLYNGFTLVGVFIGILIADKISRRAFLMFTFYGAGAILAVMTIWQDMPPTIALVLLGAFSTVLAISIVAEWLYPPELFPTELRGSGVGLTIAASRIGAGMGTWMLPVITEQYGVTVTLTCCIATLVIGGVVCQLLAPETSPKYVNSKASPAVSVGQARV
ncbi:MFS transporter, putative metabolite transport protein [Paucidesulfovibrio gracilis DSM 16080]|uniref:MFS transporter, putative metabolite transport protein n=1 Tax=Paucidesulfovibrio gracilis DSM 16080 TaxID=1121449 RepID=A0A1T4W2I7_9BACT|nr:MFS transporter [Paucidesulfovibrio gracilis]SKA71407.1 MFS transporter, putative metabolite transport protein [Paucidesulfovibrio gracilis DSM 16080]